MPYERLRPSFVFDEERLNYLQQIAPEAFTDGKVNWEVLKESLGEHLEEEGQETEHFGLFWPGKRQARKMASIPSKGTLIPVKGEGVNEETTKNIFIEGENLEVLKLLQKSYAGRIKMIYIDPPYNTGNDFVYDDNFTEPLEEYLKYSGQMDEEGKLLTTNKKADGRFHSKWLSMLYPRLRLARNMLCEEGVIFVSIDDNEVHHLRLLLNEIFGEENFIAQIVIKSNPRGSMSPESIGMLHEYVILYAKNKQEVNIVGHELSQEMLDEYKYQNQKGEKYRLLGLRQRGGFWRRSDRPSLYYPLFINPGDCSVSITKSKKHYIELYPIQPTTGEEGSWRWGKEKIENNLELLIGKKIKRDGKEEWDVFQLDYLQSGKEENKRTKAKSIWDEKEINYQNGTAEVKNLFDGKQCFDFPKPLALLRNIVSMVGTNDGDYILDFFAGSGTTAHAVISQNQEEHLNRRFIMVQMPEFTDEKSEARKCGYKTISSVCKERIRRAIKLTEKSIKKTDDKVDYGFCMYKLEKSSFIYWQNYEGSDIKQIEDLFSKQSSPLVDRWKPENLLVEITLQEGFPLDSDIEELKEHKKNEVIQVSSGFCQHRLFISLDKKIAQDTIDNLKIEGEDIFVCLDNALTDEQKVTLSDKGFLKTI